MKKYILCTLIFFMTFIISSCNNERRRVISYKTYENDVYSVDIPMDFCIKKSIGDLMSFEQEKLGSFISIQSLKNENLLNYAQNHNLGGNKFSYSLIGQTDTSCYYKITGNSVMWSAYQLYMTKRIGEMKYVISVSSSSDVQSKNELIALITHIQKSLISHSQKSDLSDNNNVGTVVEEKTDDDSFATRETKSYSIEYPKEWKVVLNPDQYTDVYLGDYQGKVGCTVLFVDTDYSINEIIEDGNTNMKNAGARVTSNKKLEINGVPCYKTIYEYSLSNMSVKQISYTFKKGNTMYNVKFGNNKQTIDANIALIDKIISSFKIK